MRQIKIDSVFQKFEDFITEELKKEELNTEELNTKKLNNKKSLLCRVRDSFNSFLEKNDEIKNILVKKSDNKTFDFKSFLLLKPSEITEIINKYDSKIFYDIFDSGKEGATKLSESIQKILNYNEFRKDYARIISEITEIKACPYCNAMLTVSYKKKDGFKSRFQLDHFYGQAKHPLFSICIFNLIPSCQSCNHLKKEKDFNNDKHFHLYTEKEIENKFVFKVTEDSIVNYVVNQKYDNFEIKLLNENEVKDDFINEHNRVFQVESLYNTQKDIVEEIYWKKMIYNDDYIESLKEILSKTKENVSVSELKRIVVGNYVEEENIHKRPMSKFMQDIAKQFKLI